MRVGIIPSAALVGILAVSFVSAKAASPDQLHVFYGEVKAVDLAAKTLTIKSGGKNFVFHYTDKTKISSRNEHVSWDKIRPGQGAAVVMRLGEGNIGIAVNIRFDFDARLSLFLSLCSARTTRGETISGIAVNDFVAYEPPSDRFNRGIDFGKPKLGMFLLVVQPDGTVGNITTLKSLGVTELDERAAEWLKKWKFRPNSVSEVRMPVVHATVWR